MNEKEEEILEAVWTAAEYRNYSVEAVRKLCVVDFDDDDIAELERKGLVVRNAGKILFSGEGKKISEGIIRRHRLAEVLVTSILKLKKPDMEEVACKVEHALLPEVEESICTLLGHPEVCPDGKQIPRGSCCEDKRREINNTVVSLVELSPGDSGKITYIKPGSHSNLHQLISLGLQPGIVVTMHRSTPVFCVKFENTEVALDREIAANIFVWRVGNGEGRCRNGNGSRPA